MAVVSCENRLENVVFCVEFIFSLKVANLYIGFCDVQALPDVKHVICERQSVTVTLKTDEIGRTVAWTDPIYLLPNTCSRITQLKHGLLVRCNFEDDNNDDIVSENVFVPRYDRIRCRFCGNDLMKSESKPVTTRVPISALGLPKGLDWDQMSMTYFCHEHGCGGETIEHDESEPPKSVKNAFAPQISEYFDCETYLVFNEDVLDRNQIKNSETGAEIACLRCHKRIGETSLNGITLKLFCDAITDSDPFSYDDDGWEMRILANILISCSRRLLFVNADGRMLSVVIMDKRLKTIRTRFDTRTTEVKRVWKLLYKPYETEQRSAVDTAVKVVHVHRELFSKFVGLLTKSTDQLPSALRFADDFCIAYVPYC